MPTYEVLLFYKFVSLKDPQAVTFWQKELCTNLGLKGRILVAEEGINGTVEGTTEAIKKYIQQTKMYSPFADINFKKSPGTGTAFNKLSVRLRDEIVTLGLPKEERWDCSQFTGQFLTAEELHDWIHNQKKEFYILDLRNTYEHQSGYFVGSILPNLSHFRDLPELLPTLEFLKDKTVVTVCTGGIRCEKATGLLIKYGFKDVWQLKDGIVTYMEKYPNEDFVGKLYVFDSRYLLGFNTEDSKHQVVGRCLITGKPCENYVNFIDPLTGERRHGIVSQEAIDQGLVRLD